MQAVKQARNFPSAVTAMPAWALLATSLLISLGWWHWAETILIPSNTAYAQEKRIPIGNNSDLYPRWLGARELLLRGSDPYSEQVTQGIQRGYYGRSVDPTNPDDPHDQAAFAYPLYVVFVLAPFVRMPFAEAQTIFQWLLIACLGGSVAVWADVVGFRPGWKWTAAFVVLALSTSAAISEFHKQNLSALVILLLALAVWTVRRNWLFATGFLLAWSTLKPQLGWLFILFLLAWAVSRWKERQRLGWGFLFTQASLVMSSCAVMPGWFGRFWHSLHEYQKTAADPSIMQVLLPDPLAIVVTLLLLGWVGVLCWRERDSGANSEGFTWALAGISAVTLATMNKLAAYNQPLLVPALFVLLSQWDRVMKAGLMARTMSKASVACLVWPWIAAAVISALSFFVQPNHLRAVAGVPQYTLLTLVPVTLLAVIAAERSVRATR